MLGNFESLSAGFQSHIGWFRTLPSWFPCDLFRVLSLPIRCPLCGCSLPADFPQRGYLLGNECFMSLRGRGKRIGRGCILRCFLWERCAIAPGNNSVAHGRSRTWASSDWFCCGASTKIGSRSLKSRYV